MQLFVAWELSKLGLFPSTYKSHKQSLFSLLHCSKDHRKSLLSNRWKFFCPPSSQKIINDTQIQAPSIGEREREISYHCRAGKDSWIGGSGWCCRLEIVERERGIVESGLQRMDLYCRGSCRLPEDGVRKMKIGHWDSSAEQERKMGARDEDGRWSRALTKNFFLTLKWEKISWRGERKEDHVDAHIIFEL